MPNHSPIKSIKIDFHGIDAMTPKPDPLPQQPPIDNGMGAKKAPAPQTKLSPMEETLFPSWAAANGVDSSAHSDPNNHFDFRGLYKQSQGKVQTPGAVGGASDTFNRLMASKPDYAALSAGIKPVPSHPQGNGLTSPGVPDINDLNAQKQGIMSQGQTTPEPIQQLIQLLNGGR